jgi:hypothetical protein
MQIERQRERERGRERVGIKTKTLLSLIWLAGYSSNAAKMLIGETKPAEVVLSIGLLVKRTITRSKEFTTESWGGRMAT